MQTAPSAISGFTAVTSGGKAKASKEQPHDEASGFANQLRSAMPDETDDHQGSPSLNGTASSVDAELDEQRIQGRRRLANRSARAELSTPATHTAQSASEVGASDLDSSADLQAIAEPRPETNEAPKALHESKTGSTDQFSASLANLNKPTNDDSEQTTIADKRIQSRHAQNNPSVQDQQDGSNHTRAGEPERLDESGSDQSGSDQSRSDQSRSDQSRSDQSRSDQSRSSATQPNDTAPGDAIVAAPTSANSTSSSLASGADKSDQNTVTGPDDNTRSKTRATPTASESQAAQSVSKRHTSGGDASSAPLATKTKAAMTNPRGDSNTPQAADTRRALPRKAVAAKSIHQASRDQPEKTASIKSELPFVKPLPLSPTKTQDPDSDRQALAIHRSAAGSSRPVTELAHAPGNLPDIEAPLDPENVSEAFQGQLTERLVMAIKNDMSRADIRITPNELGPISIELTVEGNTASVSFAAESSQTRNALQDSLSFLRDQLAREGLTLGEASVGEQPNHAFNQRGDDHPTDEWTAVAGETADPLSDTTLPTGYRPSPSGQGLVDLFA